MSYYTTVREQDILRNVIVSGYIAFNQINKFFVNIVNIFICDKIFLQVGWNGFASQICLMGCSLETLVECIEVWCKIFKKTRQLGKPGYISELWTFLPLSFVNNLILSKQVTNLSSTHPLFRQLTLLYIRKHLYCTWTLKKCLKLSTVKSTRHDTIFLFLWRLWGHCQVFAAFVGTRSF